MAVAFCPECDEGIALGTKPFEGQRVTCRSCGADLEVIGLKPLELDWVYQEPEEVFNEDEWDDEDWDDEDWEDEDWEDEDWDDEEDEESLLTPDWP